LPTSGLHAWVRCEAQQLTATLFLIPVRLPLHQVCEQAATNSFDVPDQIDPSAATTSSRPQSTRTTCTHRWR
jgi:hypothetical protein